MIELPRRRFLSGLVGLIATPAVVKASSLMKIVPLERRNELLTVNMITREAVRLWKNSNAFMQNIDAYSAEFAVDNAKIGAALRIRLPSNDWRATA